MAFFYFCSRANPALEKGNSMSSQAYAILAAVVLVPAATIAQQPPPTQIAEDAPFQIRYAANLNIGDSIVNITNSGASSTTPATSQNGNICANVYVFLPNENIMSCCSCFVSPNGLLSLSVNNDLTKNGLLPVKPNSVVIKLLATLAGNDASSCTTSTAANAAGPNNPAVPGMVAYGTTLHAILDGKKPLQYTVTETKFTPATLSSAEATSLRNLCGFIVLNGSGFGICGCGAAAQQ
jgi:hypothetical protein